MRRDQLRIIVADRECATRRATERYLRAAGFSVQTAATGEDVILLCNIEPPDVLIVDLDLPDRDGFEVCAYVRHETRDFDVTVIMMAEPTDALTRTYLGQMVDYVGGDFFFAKPCDNHLLLMLLDELTGDRPTPENVCLVGSPTRVTWPTAHVRVPASSC